MGMTPRNTILICGPGRTKQAMKAECDINNIMARYRTTGLVTHIKNHPGFYADVEDMSDYRTAIEQIRAADKYFMKLPSRIRDHFDNDVAAFLDYTSKPQNKDEMRELGLLPPEPAKDTRPVAQQEQLRERRAQANRPEPSKAPAKAGTKTDT